MNTLKETLIPELAQRKKQLSRERLIDAQLQDRTGRCPQFTHNYFMAYREWNRRTYQKTYADLWNYRKHATEYIQETDVHHTELEQALSRDDPCSELHKLTLRLINRVDSPNDTD